MSSSYLQGNQVIPSGDAFTIKNQRISLPFRVGSIQDLKQLASRMQVNTDSLVQQLNRLLLTLNNSFDLVHGVIRNANQPVCFVANSTNQSISGSSQQQVTFNTVKLDTHNMFDDANDLIRIKVPGKYIVSAGLELGTGVNSVRGLLYKNDSSTTANRLDRKGVTGTADSVTLFSVRDLDISDTVFVEVDNQNTGAINVVRGNDFSANFYVYRIGDATV